MNARTLFLGVAVVCVLTISAVVLATALLPARYAPDDEERDIPGKQAAPAGSDAVDIADLRGRVKNLERKLAAQEARVRELETAAVTAKEADDGRIAGNILAEALETSSPKLDELIIAAIARAKERRAAADKDGAVGKKGKKDVFGGKDPEEIVEWFDGEIDRWAQEYWLNAGQVGSLKNLVRRSIDTRMEAEARGADELELRSLDVESQAEVRRIVGDDVYIETERERLAGEARGGLFWVSLAVGGLNEEQHKAIDEIVEARVEEALPDTLRLRSVPMTDEEYEATQARLEEGNESVWDAIRNDVLTEEQRARIPGK